MWTLYFCPVVSSFFFLLLSSPNLSGHRVDVYHTHTHHTHAYIPYTWCGLSANLEWRSEMCCMRLAGNTGRKSDAKIVIWAPSHEFVGLSLRN